MSRQASRDGLSLPAEVFSVAHLQARLVLFMLLPLFCHFRFRGVGSRLLPFVLR